ncbi:MAG: double zinc ribbon domain-containing protein [Pseudomonadota bacterium]
MAMGKLAHSGTTSRAGAILDTLIPPICPVSGQEVTAQGALAPEAWAELAFLTGPRCRSCGREIPGLMPEETEFRCDICTIYAQPWQRGRAAFRYDGTGRRLILSLKHGDRLDLVPSLARWMLTAGPELVAEANLIAPIPLHWTRMLKRRYNQAGELARKICRLGERHAAFAPDLLRRTRRTPPQDGKNRAARIENIEKALTLSPHGRRTLPGKRVLLIDDVLTTGATLAAATRVCLEGGAAGVDVLVSALVNFEEKPYVPPVEAHEDPDNETD